VKTVERRLSGATAPEPAEEESRRGDCRAGSDDTGNADAAAATVIGRLRWEINEAGTALRD
jgi:hypothetical protein